MVPGTHFSLPFFLFIDIGYFFLWLIFQRYVNERASQNNEQQQQNQRTHLDSSMMVANNGMTIINGSTINGHMITLNIHVPHDNIIHTIYTNNETHIGIIRA